MFNKLLCKLGIHDWGGGVSKIMLHSVTTKFICQRCRDTKITRKWHHQK